MSGLSFLSDINPDKNAPILLSPIAQEGKQSKETGNNTHLLSQLELQNQTIHALNSRVFELQKAEEELKKAKIYQVQSKQKQFEIIQLSKKIQAYEAQIQSLESEIEADKRVINQNSDLSSQLDQNKLLLQKERDRNEELLEVLQELKGQIITLKEQFQLQQEELDEIPRLTSQINEVRAVSAQKDAQYNLLSKIHAEMETHLIEIEEENEELREQIINNNGYLTTKANTSLSFLDSCCSQELDDLRKTVLDQQEQLAKEREEHEKAKEEIKYLNHRCELMAESYSEKIRQFGNIDSAAQEQQRIEQQQKQIAQLLKKLQYYENAQLEQKTALPGLQHELTKRAAQLDSSE